MTMLSRRRCMLHEEKQWNYEWYPVNGYNQFCARFIDVQEGNKVIINYFALDNDANDSKEKTGYLYDARGVGLGYANSSYSGSEYTIRFNSGETVMLDIPKSGKLAFSCFWKETDKEGTVQNADNCFTGKYIKIRIE